MRTNTALLQGSSGKLKEFSRLIFGVARLTFGVLVALELVFETEEYGPDEFSAARRI